MLHALFELYRRTTWFLAVVLALSVVTFALAPAPTLSQSLPRFINSQPKSLNHYAWKLAQSIAQDDHLSAWSSYELARLGAVSLPHVLPKLDSLPPEGRIRVLTALEPVARRMGLTHASGGVAQLSANWLTYLSDSSVYLHPAMVKRLVERFIADPNTQHTRDLRRVDSFALRDLIDAVGAPAALPRERERKSRIVEELRHITGHDATWSLPPASAPLDEKSEVVVEKWKEWWFAERHLYEAPTSTSNLTAPLLQTQFALWVRSGAGAWFDRGLSSTLRAVPWLPLLRSVCLFVVALVGGNALTRLFDHRSTTRRWAASVRAVITTLSWFPAALLAALAHRRGLAGIWIAAPLVALCGAGLTLRRHARRSRPNNTSPPPPTAAAATYTATLLSICLLVEWGLRVDGLGPILVEAIKRADATPVLCVALVNTSLIGIVQYLSPRLASQRSEDVAP